jgi:acrylyl-CoA reductase (NADPH)
MTPENYSALVVDKTADDRFVRSIKEKEIKDLPAHEVLIQVHYSSLNYKDALSATGNKGVTRRYPHTPGIDAAGIVAASSVDGFQPGDEVIACCYDLGMNTPGGFGQYIRVPAAWVLKVPSGLSLRESMIYGTAGFTAAQCVLRLAEHQSGPAGGKILVTGATGGVGSMAVGILARMGYQVSAVTGKPEAAEFLRELGAAEVIAREQAIDTKGRALLREKWAGVVDTVGGEMLATAIKSTRYGGVVTCCGNVAGAELPLTVYPFILRGVTLIGIDSAECSMAIRQRVWQKLAGEWKLPGLDGMAAEISLHELDRHIELILAGKEKGRVVVNLRDTAGKITAGSGSRHSFSPDGCGDF